MADEADRADEWIQAQLEESLAKARQVVKPHLGHCYCGELVGRRFCGSECKEEYEFDKSRGRVK